MEFLYPPNPLLPCPKRAHKTGQSTFTKYGTHHEVEREVEAIDFVRHHTSLPIPSVIESHLNGNSSWLSMSQPPSWRIIGRFLVHIERRKTSDQPGRTQQPFLPELRAIQPPQTFWIGSCPGGPAYDHRLNDGLPCGPFVSESDFNHFLLAGVKQCPRPALCTYYGNQLRDDPSNDFSHANLSGDDILVDPRRGKITGVIDWEMAGWWPECCKYTKAHIGSRYENRGKSLMFDVSMSFPHDLENGKLS